MKARAIEILATWFYLGKLKPGPGTWGTLGAAPLILILGQLGGFFYLVTTVFFMVFAMVVAELYERRAQVHDSSEIVIDEVVGFMVAMTWLPQTWQAWVMGFFLFRFLDILKPPPISWLDRQVKGGVGVVADDVAAGILVNMIMQVVFTHTNWLGIQWNL